MLGIYRARLGRSFWVGITPVVVRNDVLASVLVFLLNASESKRILSWSSDMCIVVAHANTWVQLLVASSLCSFMFRLGASFGRDSFGECSFGRVSNHFSGGF